MSRSTARLAAVLVDQARCAILSWNRIICSAQSNDPQLSFEPVGAMQAVWNDAEWLNSNGGL